MFTGSGHYQAAMNQASAVTVSGSTATLLSWGFHLSDIFAFISCLCAVIGVTVQVYLALSHRRAVRAQEAATVAVANVADAVQSVAKKSD